MLDYLFGDTVVSYNEEMDKWINSLAVITGASAGIGACLTEIFVKAGINVVGIARRVDSIKEHANKLSGEAGKLYALKCDLTNQESILQTFAWIEETLGPISILVNNAGFIQPTTLIDGDISMWRNTLDVNILALCICTREAIKSMQKHEIDGHIFHLNSVVGHYIPEMPEEVFNIYPATKHAVTALTETLRKELRNRNSKIKITAISPGMVTTEFQNGLNNDSGLRDAVLAAPALTPIDVANAVMYALGTPPNVQVHDIIIRVQGEAF